MNYLEKNIQRYAFKEVVKILATSFLVLVNASFKKSSLSLLDTRVEGTPDKLISIRA
jgi:hypothetical protein